MKKFKPMSKMTEDEEEKLWQDASARDILKDLGPISKEEHDYYMNLQ